MAQAGRIDMDLSNKEVMDSLLFNCRFFCWGMGGGQTSSCPDGDPGGQPVTVACWTRRQPCWTGGLACQQAGWARQAWQARQARV